MKIFYKTEKAISRHLRLLLTSFCFLFSLSGFANNFTVSNTNDAGTGSFRQAITDALAAGVGPHVINATTVTGTINLQSALPLISNVTLTINGPSPNKGTLTLNRGSSSFFRLFTVENSAGPATLSLSRLSLTNGNPNANGGAISITSANVTLSYCTISNCTTTAEGGAIYLVGTTAPVLTLESCSIVNNIAGTTNVSGRGGAISTMVQALPKATVNATNCTFANNTSGVNAGGINLTYTIGNFKNCTISGNTAQSSSGGGLTVGSSSEATLTNCTITRNKSLTNVAGGIRANSTAPLTLINTLVVGNFGTNGTTPDDINWSASAITGKTASYSVIGAHTGQAFGTTTQSTFGTSSTPANVNLGNLAYNGGPTQTHLLLSSSPEIAKDKGMAVTPALSADQRGATRVMDDAAIPNATGGNGSDIGAYEVKNFTWSGTASSAFDNTASSNWTEGAAPTSGNNVFIAEGVVTREPVVSSNSTVNNLVLGAGHTLTISAGSTLSIGGSFTDNGTINGSGAITVANLSNNGIIAPGNSPGKLTVNGNFDNSTGLLSMELGGAATAGTDYDQLSVSGTATLSGDLNVGFVNGFTPVAGNQFTLLTYASKTGTFNNITLPSIAPLYWNVVYNATSVVLSATIFPLPVNLVAFTGTNTTAGNLISWKTTAESRLKEYVVEVSQDAKNWVGVFTVNAKNTAGENAYSFLHKTVANEHYYRLKAVDDDGKFKLSQTIKLNVAVSKGIVAFPNPATDRVTFTLPSMEATTVQFVNTGGQVVLQKTTTGNAVTIAIQSLPAGVYHIRIQQGQKVSTLALQKD